ncbi:MAG: dephospho-CoA kinase [Proteobacteria bacterium]|nr:dephospho-CoA kinase [Pseudomonadota bacterium]
MAGAVTTIGLTGGIGSGKSTVARMLADLGAGIVDTDALARALTAPGGAALPAIADAFGAAAIDRDGALDRAHMRTVVFAGPDAAQARQRLEAILHPLILTQALADARQLMQARPGWPVVFDVPLLVESGHWADRVDKVLVVECPPDEQVRRVMARSGWTEADVRRVIAQQASNAQRRAVADAVIVNHAITLEALRAEVDRVWQAWALPVL